MNNTINSQLVLPDSPAEKIILPTRTEPVLAKSVHSDLVVLFCSLTNGVVLCNADGPASIGYYYNWEDINKKDHWTILPKGAKVILTVI
jgi:hypothetical protein